MAKKKKKKDDPYYIEAKKVLLNHVELDVDGHFITTDEFRFQLWGAADGENMLRIWGLSSRAFIYHSEQNNTQAVFKVGKAMSNIGRGINLRLEDDDAVACLVRPVITYPVVLVFGQNEEKELVLSAYTPRCPTAFLAIKLAVGKLDKNLDGVVERLDNGEKIKKEYVEVDDTTEPEKNNKEFRGPLGWWKKRKQEDEDIYVKDYSRTDTKSEEDEIKDDDYYIKMVTEMDWSSDDEEEFLPDEADETSGYTEEAYSSDEDVEGPSEEEAERKPKPRPKNKKNKKPPVRPSNIPKRVKIEENNNR